MEKVPHKVPGVAVLPDIIYIPEEHLAPAIVPPDCADYIDRHHQILWCDHLASAGLVSTI